MAGTFTSTTVPGSTAGAMASGTPGSAAATARNPLIESDRVEGTAVYGADRERIGHVERLMIDKQSGQVAYAVMNFGGFLGIGEESYTLPWGTLTYDTDLGGYRTTITADQLKGSPDFYRRDEYNWDNRDRERDLHDYYGVSPYWGL